MNDKFFANSLVIYFEKELISHSIQIRLIFVFYSKRA